MIWKQRYQKIITFIFILCLFGCCPSKYEIKKYVELQERVNTLEKHESFIDVELEHIAKNLYKHIAETRESKNKTQTCQGEKGKGR
jgi:hypothetical protein